MVQLGDRVKENSYNQTTGVVMKIDNDGTALVAANDESTGKWAMISLLETIPSTIAAGDQVAYTRNVLKDSDRDSKIKCGMVGKVIGRCLDNLFAVEFDFGDNKTEVGKFYDGELVVTKSAHKSVAQTKSLIGQRVKVDGHIGIVTATCLGNDTQKVEYIGRPSGPSDASPSKDWYSTDRLEVIKTVFAPGQIVKHVFAISGSCSTVGMMGVVLKRDVYDLVTVDLDGQQQGLYPGELEIVPEPKIEVGSIVKYVTKIRPGNTRAPKIGEVGEVISNNNGNQFKISVRFPGMDQSNSGWWFYPQELEVVTSKYTFKVGDKIKYVEDVRQNTDRKVKIGATGKITDLDNGQVYNITVLVDGTAWYFFPQELEPVDQSSAPPGTQNTLCVKTTSVPGTQNTLCGWTTDQSSATVKATDPKTLSVGDDVTYTGNMTPRLTGKKGKITRLSNEYADVCFDDGKIEPALLQRNLTKTTNVQLKLGDKVKYVKEIRDGCRDFQLGRIGTVTSVNNGNKYNITVDEWYFSPDELELVESPVNDHGKWGTFEGFVQERNGVFCIVKGPSTKILSLGDRATHLKDESGVIAAFQTYKKLEHFTPATQADFDKQEKDLADKKVKEEKDLADKKAKEEKDARIAEVNKWSKDMLLDLLRQHSIGSDELIAVALEKARKT